MARANKTSLRAMLAASCAGAAIIASGALAEDNDTRRFEIDGQDLATALNQFAAQSDKDILFSNDQVRALTTRGVTGNYAPQDALAIILADSGFVYRETDDGVLLVETLAASGEPRAESIDGRTLLAQADAPGTSTGRTREKIIVTGQKREEYIQDVPIAISAFSQEDLTTAQIAGGPDLITQIPNFTFTKTNFSGYSIQIRGIGTQAISATTDPAVAVAFNNIPFIRNRFFEQEFYDMERVEVLRGPQGTLYGRNATAGVVNLISAKPVFDDEARVSLDLGNYNSERFEAMVNIPIVEDQVALRIAGAATKRDGYVTNEITGSPIDGRDLWSTRLSLRMAPNDRIDANLIWEHFEEDDDRLRSGKQLCKRDAVTEIGGLPVTYNGRFTGFSPLPYQSQLSQGCERASLYSDDSFQVPNGYALPYYYPLSLVGLPAALTTDPYEDQTQSRDLRVIQSTADPSYRAKTDVVEFLVDFGLTDRLTLTSETSWASDFIFATQDYNRFNTQPGAWEQTEERPGVLDDGVFCDPQVGCSDRLTVLDLSTASSQQFSQEFRLASSFSGPFNFSLGANFLRYDTHEKYYVFVNAVTLWAASGNSTGIATPYIPSESTNIECRTRGLESIDVDDFGGVSVNVHSRCIIIDPNPIDNLNDLGHNYFLSKNPYDLISYAAFGEAYWNLTDNLKLTAGLRYSVDRKKAPRIPNWITANRCCYPVLEVIDQEWKEPTGRLVLDWKPDLAFTDETLIYGSYARGYKAGGANPPPAGVALNINVAGGLPDPSETKPRTFDAEYVDAFEVGSKNTFFDGDVTLNVAAFYYDYEGYQISEIVDRSAVNRNFDAEVWGAEIEAEWWALENLRLSFKGGYEKTRIADGEQAIDLMDRTAGVEGWHVAKPFPIYPSNCILPDSLWSGSGTVKQIGVIVSGSGACDLAYIDNLDPITWLPYVENPTVGAFGSGLGAYPAYPNPGYYPGWDPLTAPNNGEGFFKQLGGNELPNAPHYTATLSGDYILPLGTDWTLTFHTDLHYQSEAWWRVFQDHEYARLNEYYTMNLAAILKSEDGWNIMGYIKNVTDETAITGAFLNSDDTGLTTNVFLTEPRLYGVRVTKDWTGGTFLGSLFGGERRDPNKPYPFEVELGGQVQRWDAPNDAVRPTFADLFSPTLDTNRELQDRDLDWGDGREVKLTYRPEGRPWQVSAGVRFGKTNNTLGRTHRGEESPNAGCLFKADKYLPASQIKYDEYCLPGGSKYETKYVFAGTNWSDITTRDREEYTLVDFRVGRDVGVGGLSRSTIGLGLRYAQFVSTTDMTMNGIPDWYVPDGWIYQGYGKYFPTSHYYQASLKTNREFEGAGPMLSWDAATKILGGDDVGRLDLDWSIGVGVLFGKQDTSIVGDEAASYFHDVYTELGTTGEAFVREYIDTIPTEIDIRRNKDTTAPFVDASLGLSYNVDRFTIGAGYRWERYYDVLDGGGLDGAAKVDRTIDGPYFKVAVGFGG